MTTIKKNTHTHTMKFRMHHEGIEKQIRIFVCTCVHEEDVEDEIATQVCRQSQ